MKKALRDKWLPDLSNVDPEKQENKTKNFIEILEPIYLDMIF